MGTSVEICWYISDTALYHCYIITFLIIAAPKTIGHRNLSTQKPQHWYLWLTIAGSWNIFTEEKKQKTILHICAHLTCFITYWTVFSYLSLIVTTATTRLLLMNVFGIKNNYALRYNIHESHFTTYQKHIYSLDWETEISMGFWYLNII